MGPFLLAVVLGATPVEIEPLGFSVSVEDGAVTVVSVADGSVAARAGLTPGAVFEQLLAPQWLFVRKPLALLSQQDLHDALVPPHGEPLIVGGRIGGSPHLWTMLREDPAPANPFAGAPFPPQKVARLSVRQLAPYNVYVLRLTRQRSEAARPVEPFLAFSEQATVVTSAAGLHQAWNSAWSPQWVYYEGRLDFRCPHSPMRRIELAGPSLAPQVVAESSDGALRGSSVPCEVPLWRVSEVLDACRRGASTLESTKVTGTLQCEGEEPRRVELSPALSLKCGAGSGRPWPRLDALRLGSPAPVLTGSGPVEVRVSWDSLRPTPIRAALLELDAAGREVRRFPPLALQPTGELRLQLPIDTSHARTGALAMEVKFADGSIERSPPQELRVQTPAQRDAELNEFNATLAKMEAVQARLFQAFPKPCAAPDETVRWLEAQPEVAIATNHEGHNLSFVVDELPIMVMCHER